MHMYVFSAHSLPPPPPPPQMDTYTIPLPFLQISRPDSLTSIDWDTLEKDPDIVIAEGSQNTGYQYHFYMETQSAIAYPTEGGGIKVYASSQAPNPLHGQVSTATNLPLNKISIEVSTRLYVCMCLSVCHYSSWYTSVLHLSIACYVPLHTMECHTYLS